METKDIDSLLAWYDEYGRRLPWREDVTPYHVWISEVMLQQTRVESVKGYYTRFLNTLPDIRSLASCEEDVYLKLWQGLGYYSRVRNLHKGAIYIIEKYDGKIPDDYEELRTIPSIGEYTAKAILSIAYKKNYVAIDGNLLRIFARLNLYDSDIKDNKAKIKGEAYFRPFLKERPDAFNQALMDLGELICLPHGQPKCLLCPFKNICLANLNHSQLSYPVSFKNKDKRIVDKTVFIIHYQDQYLIQKRKDTGLLASLYEFINIDEKLNLTQTKEYLLQQGFNIKTITYLHQTKHTFTHLIWQMEGYDVTLDSLPKGKGLLFVNKEDLEQKYSIPSAFAYFLKMILL